MSSTTWNKISQTTIINCSNKGLRGAAPEPQSEPVEEEEDIFHGFTAEEVAEAEKKFADYQDGLPLTTLMKQWADKEAPVTQPPLTDEEIQKTTENPAAPTDLTTPDKEDDLHSRRRARSTQELHHLNSGSTVHRTTSTLGRTPQPRNLQDTTDPGPSENSEEDAAPRRKTTDTFGGFCSKEDY